MLVRWRRKFWNEIVQQLQYYWFPDDSWVCYTHTHTYTYDIYYFFKNVRLYHLVQSGVTSTIWNSLMLPVPSGTVWCYQYHPVHSGVTSTIRYSLGVTSTIRYSLVLPVPSGTVLMLPLPSGTVCCYQYHPQERYWDSTNKISSLHVFSLEDSSLWDCDAVTLWLCDALTLDISRRFGRS